MNNVPDKEKRMEKTYDVITIGSGPAGGTAAGQFARNGLKSALIEHRGWGGTCPLRGCNPKKVLYNAAETTARAADLAGKGLRADVEIDWRELQQFKNTFTEPVPEKVEDSYRKKGVDLYEGKARFSGPGTLQAGRQKLSAPKIFIAAGAVPRPLDVPGAHYALTSDDFFELKSLPDRIAFIGGGYIAFELAHICARLNRRVTILEAGGQPLGRFDPDLVQHLVKASEAAGVTVETGITVRGIEKSGKGFTVLTDPDAASAPLSVDAVFNTTGRIPDLADLDLEAGSVAYTQKGIQVDAYLQSVSNPDVYAAGDCADTPYRLTPAASREGETAAHNIIRGNSRQHNPQGTPSVVFTNPPMASVGLLESQAEQQELDFETRFADTASWFTSKSSGLAFSAMKIIVQKPNQRILGAHLLGRHVDEMINVFALAVRFDLTAIDLMDAIYTYPSATRELRHLLG